MDTVEATTTAATHNPYYTPPPPRTTYGTRVYYTPPSVYQAAPTQQNDSPQPTGGEINPSNDGTPWDNLGAGPKSAIVLMTFVGAFIIIVLSAWFCCGCCGLRQKRRIRRRKAKEAVNPNPRHLEMGEVQVQEIQRREPGPAVAAVAAVATGTRDVPPPRYDDVVSPQHQMATGGIRHVREEDEGVISDGKTPLSEMTFEDVVLDHSPSEGSARTFQERHYFAGGDTTGHTNS